MNLEIVLTRDRSSGRIHKRVREGNRLLVDERCNLDAAGAFDEVTEAALEDADVGQACEFCFPPATD